MAIHSDALARVLARLEQTLVQGFTRSFLRVCKGCNRCVQPCLTYMCARACACALDYLKLLQLLQLLQPLLSIFQNGGNPPFAVD